MAQMGIKGHKGQNFRMLTLGVPALTAFALIVSCTGRVSADLDSQCPLGPELVQSSTLIGYVGENVEIQDKKRTFRLGEFRALAIHSTDTLVATDGSAIRAEMQFWPLLDQDSTPHALSGISSILDIQGEDHCVYSASFTISDLPRWTLVGSKPLRPLIRRPALKERDSFDRRNSKCIMQGDYEPGEQPPCARPNLLAVSDIDRDGLLEFWATEPYMWDTGFSVSEEEGSDGLVRIIEVCPLCAD